MSLVYEARKVTELHGRGDGVIEVVISAILLVLCVAIMVNVRGFAERIPWRGSSSSDPEKRTAAVIWGRAMSVVVAVIALGALLSGIHLIATGSLGN